MSDHAHPHSPTTFSAGEALPFTGYWLREPNRDDVHDIAAWLAQPTINRWFDFGLGRQALTALAVLAMLQSRRHRIRVFGPTGYRAPSGLVAVSDITHRFATGSFWVLRDSQRPAYADMTYDASRSVLRESFECDKLHCITAWAVETNVASQRLLGRLGFRTIGLQRACHLVDGKRLGRLLYDLLRDDLAAPSRTS
ncbi:MAG: N-acetyltransferase [Pandoraea sp.]|uniref:N-acetyltransferase n=1 Tax=Trinickia dabaoshanensis TaxID=564714 RepID=A0A2N7VI51_9BURK|nr:MULTISPECIES: GNAT family N-acetyltransferase [Burkholderiaceae]PMS16823.1 N-acetyltransferase [Trinickia dabaoshanensis]TAM18576.1 MAG: N-acetyltransferase [Pandoraea sp.]TAM55319.1 MAG: N-acetyltransferase [Paraburkholderia sp.]